MVKGLLIHIEEYLGLENDGCDNGDGDDITNRPTDWPNKNWNQNKPPQKNLARILKTKKDKPFAHADTMRTVVLDNPIFLRVIKGINSTVEKMEWYSDVLDQVIDYVVGNEEDGRTFGQDKKMIRPAAEEPRCSELQKF